MSGSQAQPCPDAAQEVSEAALGSLRATALPRDVPARSELAFVFISVPPSALVWTSPLFSQVYEL